MGRAADASRPGLRRKGADLELEVGSRAHYDDPGYYAWSYRERVDDIGFYERLARASGGPVLEYGVGNGRIALPIARAGIAVTGVDHSAPMLADLGERLARAPAAVRARVTLRRGDMRSVRLARRFPLVVCPFNAALHLYTRPDVERFLARVRAHLAPRGTFVVDLSTPVLVDLARDPTRGYSVPKFLHPSTGEAVSYTEHFDYDGARQILFVSMEFTAKKTGVSWATPLAHRQFFPQEWEALLHYNGFEVDKIEGDYRGGRFDRTSDVMIWHARVRRGWRGR